MQDKSQEAIRNNKLVFHLKEIVEALMNIAPSGTEYRDGICELVSVRACWANRDVFCKMREQAYSNWAYYSGCLTFPVPAKLDLLAEHSPVDAGNRYCRTGNNDYFGFSDNKWDGEYGDARRALLNHLIKFYKAKVVFHESLFTNT